MDGVGDSVTNTSPRGSQGSQPAPLRRQLLIVVVAADVLYICFCLVLLLLLSFVLALGLFLTWCVVVDFSFALGVVVRTCYVFHLQSDNLQLLLFQSITIIPFTYTYKSYLKT